MKITWLGHSAFRIETVKAMAVEPHVARRWEEQTAGYVHANFRTQQLSIAANESVGLVGKVVNVLTLWFGARYVISGDLSVGQLIAFNMLAGASRSRSCGLRNCGLTSSRRASPCSGWATF